MMIDDDDDEEEEGFFLTWEAWSFGVVMFFFSFHPVHSRFIKMGHAKDAPV